MCALISSLDTALLLWVVLCCPAFSASVLLERDQHIFAGFKTFHTNKQMFMHVVLRLQPGALLHPVLIEAQSLAERQLA